MSRCFIDTNIFVYALNQKDKQKNKRARNVLLDLLEKDEGVISTQVLQEFYVVITQKLGCSHHLAKKILLKMEDYEVIANTPEMIYLAVDFQILYQISFWDALILVSAKQAQCEKILTEDLNHTQVISGITIENPFCLPSSRKVL